jgi:hypothetical protein
MGLSACINMSLFAISYTIKRLTKLCCPHVLKRTRKKRKKRKKMRKIKVSNESNESK